MKERIGHYSIVSELGRGGMGVVYKAHEESLNRMVALKVLGKHLSEDESFVERFKREAQSAAALNHPNIVQVYAIDEFEGQHCFAMEYVQGASIQQMIKSRGPMDPVAAGRLILQAASGLGAAHGHGIVHRDIKPANLMVDDRGLVKITDFGLALLAAGTTRLTATGMFMGTPGYLSPEQCLDEGIDQRTDIYSLGVTLYEMLTGVTPLKADSPLALLRQIIDVEPKDVGELRPEVPDRLRAILRRMMAKKPGDRYPDCSALIGDLQSWLETTGSAKSDLGAVVAATVAAISPGINSDPTVVVDSTQKVEQKTRDGSHGGSRRISAVWVTALVVILMAGIGYSAWHFGVVTETDLAASNDEDSVAEIVSSDSPVETLVNNSIVQEPAADEKLDVQNNTPADFEPGYSDAIPESSGEGGFDSETAVASVTETEISPGTEDPTYDEYQTDPSPIRTEAARSTPPIPVEPAIGTGVALVSIGEILLAETAADYVRGSLERHGIVVIDGMAIPGVASTLETGGGAIDELIRSHARYLVFIRADFTGERELNYMGRYDTEFQARLNLETRDLLDGRQVGTGVHSSIGYTQLSVENKVEELLRPKFGRIAGDLKE